MGRGKKTPPMPHPVPAPLLCVLVFKGDVFLFLVSHTIDFEKHFLKIKACSRQVYLQALEEYT